MKNLKGQKI